MQADKEGLELEVLRLREDAQKDSGAAASHLEATNSRAASVQAAHAALEDDVRGLREQIAASDARFRDLQVFQPLPRCSFATLEGLGSDIATCGKRPR